VNKLLRERRTLRPSGITSRSLRHRRRDRVAAAEGRYASPHRIFRSVEVAAPGRSRLKIREERNSRSTIGYRPTHDAISPLSQKNNDDRDSVGALSARRGGDSPQARASDETGAIPPRVNKALQHRPREFSPVTGKVRRRWRYPLGSDRRTSSPRNSGRRMVDRNPCARAAPAQFPVIEMGTDESAQRT